MNAKLYKFRPFEVVKENFAKNSIVPGPRSGHRICCDDINLYVFGGYNFNENDDSHKLYKEILSFNFISKQWKNCVDESSEDECPEELASSAMLMYGKTLVVFGGTSYPFGMTCSNKVTLVPVTNEAFPVQELVTHNDQSNHPPGQYGMSIVSKGNYLYTVGGTQGFDYTADIYRLDFLSQKWELLALSRPEIDPDQPIGRYRHEIAIDDRYIYIFGGGTSDTVFDLKSLPAYDLIDRKWCTIETYPDTDDCYPMPRKCHSLVQLTTKDCNDNEETNVYIAGGNYHGGPLKDLWKLSLKTRRWKRFKTANLRSSLFFHDACITPDACMYIFGGINTNTQRTNNLYKVWVEIPKLSVIAWEALVYYYPKIHMAPENFMLEKGVPMRFVKRVHP